MTDTQKPHEIGRSRWLAVLLDLAGKLRYGVDKAIARNSRVGNPPVFDPADFPAMFPWTRELKANWQAIRDEAFAAIEDRNAIPPLEEISVDHIRLARENRWRAYFIWGYGYRMDEHAEACPVTASLVEKIPGLNSAFFSIHAPGVHIPDHRGVTKGLLTCHLPLRVPDESSGRCTMRVHDTEYRWSEGQAMIFDDTYRHEVWNDTAEERVILLVQFGRPLAWPGSWIARLFLWLIRISPFVQDARKNIRTWRG